MIESPVYTFILNTDPSPDPGKPRETKSEKEDGAGLGHLCGCALNFDSKIKSRIPPNIGRLLLIGEGLNKRVRHGAGHTSHPSFDISGVERDPVSTNSQVII